MKRFPSVEIKTKLLQLWKKKHVKIISPYVDSPKLPKLSETPVSAYSEETPKRKITPKNFRLAQQAYRPELANIVV